MSPRLHRTTVLAVLAGTAAAGIHVMRLRRALHCARALHRLADAAHHRDQAHAARTHLAGAERAVLAAADAVLNNALETHHRPEGGDR